MYVPNKKTFDAPSKYQTRLNQQRNAAKPIFNLKDRPLNHRNVATSYLDMNLIDKNSRQRSGSCGELKRRRYYEKKKSPMETLDRRISSSTDHLNCHEVQIPQRSRSTSMLNCIDEENAQDRDSRYPRLRSQKTALDIFLEDQGPYSRKLYGPINQKPVNNSAIDESNQQKNSKKILHSHYSKSHDNLTSFKTEDNQDDVDDPGDLKHLREEINVPMKKGLLWMQKDKMFSRWKERFFVLTKDYIHCFKRGTTEITEMGTFIFKLKLIEIEMSELLDRRGYLTICLTLVKDGKIYLRRPEGIKDWFNSIQENIKDSKKRKFFWAKRQATDPSAIEQWLLGRKTAFTSGILQNRCYGDKIISEKDQKTTREQGNIANKDAIGTKIKRNKIKNEKQLSRLKEVKSNQNVLKNNIDQINNKKDRFQDQGKQKELGFTSKPKCVQRKFVTSIKDLKPEPSEEYLPQNFPRGIQRSSFVDHLLKVESLNGLSFSSSSINSSNLSIELKHSQTQSSKNYNVKKESSENRQYDRNLNILNDTIDRRLMGFGILPLQNRIENQKRIILSSENISFNQTGRSDSGNESANNSINTDLDLPLNQNHEKNINYRGVNFRKNNLSIYDNDKTKNLELNYKMAQMRTDGDNSAPYDSYDKNINRINVSYEVDENYNAHCKDTSNEEQEISHQMCHPIFSRSNYGQELASKI